MNAGLKSAGVSGANPEGTRHRRRQGGYMMTEAIVYISAVGILLTVGLVALFRCVDSALVLRRNADDISRAVHIGELWRADVRASSRIERLRMNGEEVLQLANVAKRVQYLLRENALYRRIDAGPWGRVLESVKASKMHPDIRSQVQAWQWDLELQPRSRGATGPSRMRPLFTFIAVAPAAQTQ